MASKLFLVLAIALVSFGLAASALDPVIVKHLLKTGRDCVDIGETCATCSTMESEVNVKCEGDAEPFTFCYLYSEDQCNDYDEIGWVGPYWSPCELVPLCKVSIAFDPEILLEGRLTTSNETFFFHRAQNMNGGAIVSSTSASARGYLPNVGFATSAGDTVRYIGVDQMANTATTTAGDCELGQWCQAGSSLEYRVTVVTNTTATSPEGGGFQKPAGFLVDIYSDIPVTISSSVEQQFLFRQEEILIEESGLGNFEFTMPCGAVFYGEDNPGTHRCLFSNFSINDVANILSYDVSMDGQEPRVTVQYCVEDPFPSISPVPVYDCSNRLLGTYF